MIAVILFDRKNILPRYEYEEIMILTFFILVKYREQQGNEKVVLLVAQ
jgi:hypothetical protein